MIGCTPLQVDVDAVSKMKRVVIVGFYANRDVNLSLANQQFVESRHDGEDIVPKIYATFAEKLYKLEVFHVLPPEFITSTQGYKEFHTARAMTHRYMASDSSGYQQSEQSSAGPIEGRFVSVPKLKLVNPETDLPRMATIIKTAAVDGAVVVENILSTEVRIAEGDSGSAGGRVKMSIWMVNPAGEVVWHDVVEGNSESLARVSGGTYTFPNEIQKVVLEAFDRAADDAAARLRAKLP